MSVDLNDAPPNLFEGLFNFAPRDGHTPRENFLSEAFAYILRTSEGALDAWVSDVFARRVHCESFDVRTRGRKDTENDSPVFPDMSIRGTIADGEAFEILSEHKWDSRCNSNQLCSYARIAQKSGAHLIFIGANHRQKREAAASHPAVARCYLWEDVFRVLNEIPEPSEIFKEFLNFMAAKGLSPGQPLSLQKMQAFLQSAGFVKSLERLAEKLRNDFEWNCIPSRYRGGMKVTDRWGRVAIEFATPDWKPTITVGFLYDGGDHKVMLLNAREGIDLFLRIEAGPKEQAGIKPVMEVLHRKRQALDALGANVILRGESGNVNTVVLVRSCLAHLIDQTTTEEEQVCRVHREVESWIKVLFGDGELESAFKEAGLASGLTRPKGQPVPTSSGR